jgi:hypothetical protein
MQKVLKQVTINFTDSGDFNGAQSTHVIIDGDDVTWCLPKQISPDDVTTVAELLGDDLARVLTCHGANKTKIDELESLLHATTVELGEVKAELENTKKYFAETKLDLREKSESFEKLQGELYEANAQLQNALNVQKSVLNLVQGE